MKMIKAMPMFILVFTGYLCNAQDASTTSNPVTYAETAGGLSPRRVGGKYNQSSSPSSEPSSAPSSEPEIEDHVPARRSLPTLVVAGVSIALVLLFVVIVAAFWYAWKKSQEGSIVINPIPYGEAGVSRVLPVPEN